MRRLFFSFSLMFSLGASVGAAAQTADSPQAPRPYEEEVRALEEQRAHMRAEALKTHQQSVFSANTSPVMVKQSYRAAAEWQKQLNENPDIVLSYFSETAGLSPEEAAQAAALFEENLAQSTSPEELIAKSEAIRTNPGQALWELSQQQKIDPKKAQALFKLMTKDFDPTKPPKPLDLTQMQQAVDENKKMNSLGKHAFPDSLADF